MQTVAGTAVLSVLPSAVTAWPSGVGLFFDSADIPALRKKWQLPLFAQYVQENLGVNVKEDEKFLLKELDFNNHIRHIVRANQILIRESFVYLMTGQSSRFDLALLALQQILSYPQWDYFLEAGKEVIGFQRAPETTIAVSLAYDWLADKLDEKTKRTVREQLGPKGCEPCYRTLFGLRHPDQVVGWSYAPSANLEPRDFSRWPVFINNTNLKAIPLCGLAFGAATLMGVNDQSAKWLEMVQYSYETLASVYCRDGSYPEGSSYGGYTTSHMLMAQAVLQRKLGIDLFDRVNYNGFIEFMIGLHMPHNDPKDSCVNFGDSGGAMLSSVGFYVAAKTRDGLAQYAGLHYHSSHDPFSIIWYDPAVIPEPPATKDHFKHFDLDWIVYRTGYQAEDLVVAMRSGPPANHEHGDRNSLVLKSFGEILLADNKHPTYDHEKPGWMLRTALGHNTVLIDGQGHPYVDGKEGTNMSKDKATILYKGQRRNQVFWSSDATPAYALNNPDVAAVLRSVFILPEIPLLIVVDIMKKKEKDSLFSCRWHVENSDHQGRATCGPDSFIIHRPQARFFAVCRGDQALTLQNDTMPVPVETGVFPFVQINMKDPARRSQLVMVGMPLHKDETEPAITIDRDWKITVDHKRRHHVLQLLMAGDRPFLSI